METFKSLKAMESNRNSLYNDPDYIRLKYIELTGAQRVDTGYILKSDNYDVELKAETSIAGREMCVIGCTDTEQEQQCIELGWSTTVGRIFMHQATTGSLGYGQENSPYPNAYNTPVLFHMWQLRNGDNVQRYFQINEESVQNGDGVSVVGKQFNLFSYLKTDNNTFYTTGKFYYCKIKDNGELVRYFVPVRRRIDNQTGLLDLVEYKFYSNAKYGGAVSGVPVLIDNRYELVDYIESTGTQYIDTDYYHKTGQTRYEFEVSITSKPRRYNTLFGSRVTHNGNEAYYFGIENTGTMYGCIGGTKVDPLKVNNVSYVTSNNVIYKITTAPESGITINNTLISMPRTQFVTTERTDHIFHGNFNDVSDEYMNGRIYYFKIYEGNNLVRDFIPVLNLDTHEPGLYDKVGRKFYGNEGTGKFLCDPFSGSLDIDTNQYEVVDYIETTGTQYIKTGVTGPARWEFDIQFTNIAGPRQLMGYGSSGNEYWGVCGKSGKCKGGAEDGRGEYEQYTQVGVPAGNRNMVSQWHYTNVHQLWVNGVQVRSGTAPTDVTSKEYQLFALNGSVKCYCKLYGCCVYDTDGKIIREFVPVINRETGRAGLLDKVYQQFYENDGEGFFLYGKKNINLEIDTSHYKIIDYYDSDGVSFIDTGILSSPNLIFDLKAALIKNHYGDKILIGGRAGNSRQYVDFDSPQAYTNFAVNVYCGYGDLGNYIQYSHEDIIDKKFIIQANFRDKTFLMREENVNDSLSTAADIRPNSMTGANFSLTNPSHINLFGVKIGQDFYGGSFRLYECRIFDGQTVVREFMPVVDLNTNKKGLFDKISLRFYSDARAGEDDIDNDYQVIDYIQSTGEQYIDTGVIDTNNTCIEVDAFTRTNTSTYGVDSNSYGRNLTASSAYLGGYFYYSNAGQGSRANSVEPRRAVFKQDNNICYINNIQVGQFTSETFTSARTMYLFGRNTSQGCGDSGVTRIYSCRFWKNGIIIRDYVPVISKSNEFGLYDKIERKFYPNNGTGVFGAFSNGKYKLLDYIESTGDQYINTGLTPSISYGIKINFEVTEMTRNPSPIAVQGYNGYGPFGIIIGLDSEHRNMYYGNNTWQSTNITALTKVDYVFNYNYLNNNTAAWRSNRSVIASGDLTGRTNVAEFQLPIFTDCVNGEYGGQGTFFKGRIHYVKITEGSLPKKDYFPVMNMENGEIGLYERIDKEFKGRAAGSRFNFNEISYLFDANKKTISAINSTSTTWKNNYYILSEIPLKGDFEVKFKFGTNIGKIYVGILPESELEQLKNDSVWPVRLKDRIYYENDYVWCCRQGVSDVTANGFKFCSRNQVINLNTEYKLNSSLFRIKRVGNTITYYRNNDILKAQPYDTSEFITNYDGVGYFVVSCINTFVKDLKPIDIIKRLEIQSEKTPEMPLALKRTQSIDNPLIEATPVHYLHLSGKEYFDTGVKMHGLLTDYAEISIMPNSHCYLLDQNNNKYMPVEYIESTGTQWINTEWCNTDDNYRVQLTFSLNNLSTQCLFGSRWKWSDQSVYNYIQYDGSNPPYGLRGVVFQTEARSYDIKADNIYTVSLNRDTNNYMAFNISAGKTLNNVFFSELKHMDGYANSTFNGLPMYLFAANYIPSGNDPTTAVARYMSSIKLYGCKITKDSDTSYVYRDFVPVQSVSDKSICGLFDKVNNVFYGNDGTGLFNCGGLLPKSGQVILGARDRIGAAGNGSESVFFNVDNTRQIRADWTAGSSKLSIDDPDGQQVLYMRRGEIQVNRHEVDAELLPMTPPNRNMYIGTLNQGNWLENSPYAKFFEGRIHSCSLFRDNIVTSYIKQMVGNEEQHIKRRYQILDCIKSTNNAHINTGYTWQSETTEIRAVLQLTENGSNRSLWGGEEPYQGGDRYFSGIPYGTNNSYSYYVGSTYGSQIGNITIPYNKKIAINVKTTSSKKITLSLNGETIINSVQYSGTCQPRQGSGSSSNKGYIYIFSNHSTAEGANDPLQPTNSMILYSFQLYDNNILQRSFYPAKCLETGVIGLYESVTDSFYTTDIGEFVIPENAEAITPKIGYYLPAKCNYENMDGDILEIPILYDVNAQTDKRYIFPSTMPGYIDEFGDMQVFEQVDYIQISGNQYINTGYTMASKYLKAEIKAYMEPQTAEYDIIGNYNDDSNGCAVFGNYSNYMFLYSQYGPNKTNDGNAVSATYSAGTHEITIDFRKNGNKYLTLNGTTVSHTYSQSGVLTSAPIHLFHRNDGQMQAKTGTKLYSCKIYDDGELVRDFIPVKSLYTNEYGLYDNCEKKFYLSETTQFTQIGDPVGAIEIGPELSWYEYEQLAYIESDGKQYINTGYTEIEGIEMKFAALLSYTTDMPQNQIMGYTGNRGCGIGTKWDSWWESETTFGPWENNKRYRLTWTKNGRAFTRQFTLKQKMEGGTKKGGNPAAYETVSNNNPLLLFAAWHANGSDIVDYYCHCRLYNCQIYRDGVIIHSYTPVRKLSTGEIGLYDCYTNTFYSSETDSPFIAGPTLYPSHRFN